MKNVRWNSEAICSMYCQLIIIQYAKSLSVGQKSDKKVHISFKNISKYQLNFDPDEITERFTRGDLSRNTEGSGLGLAIAKGLVQAQGGELKVDIIGDLFIVNIDFNM